MKTKLVGTNSAGVWLLMAAGVLMTGLVAKPAAGQEQHVVVVKAADGADEQQPSDDKTAPEQRTEQRVVVVKVAPEADEKQPGDDKATKDTSTDKRIVIQAIEPGDARQGAKAVTWLGVSLEETTDALTSQLGLQPGQGLVVTYVAPNSPAAKAGLEKNDVLFEFGDQLLVHPAQLRKLVQMRKEGDTVKLSVYRAGKKQTISATLAKTTEDLSFRINVNGVSAPAVLEDLRHSLANHLSQLSELKLDEKVRKQVDAARDALAGIDEGKIRIEIEDALKKAGVDKDHIRVEINEARKALRDALRQVPDAFGPASKDAQDMAEGGVDVKKNATVVIKKYRPSVKTMVKSDDSGIYVIVAAPNKHLTVHEKDGKLTFDGPIETKSQQDKVPKEIWAKVKPMLRDLGPVKEEEAEQPEANE